MFQLPICLPSSIFLSVCPNTTKCPSILHPCPSSFDPCNLVLIFIISLIHPPCGFKGEQTHSEQLP